MSLRTLHLSVLNSSSILINLKFSVHISEMGQIGQNMTKVQDKNRKKVANALPALDQFH